MPTAIAETTETQTAQAVTFIAKCPNLVLIRRGERYIDNGMGGKERQTREMWVEAQLEKNDERELAGLEPKKVDEFPWKVEFENHVYVATDVELVAWLRKHPRFNVAGPSSFYEEGAAPDEPKPTMSQQMKAIAIASAEVDVEALKSVRDTEKETHNRVPILQAVDAALQSFAGKGSGSGSVAKSGEPPSDPDKQT